MIRWLGAGREDAITAMRRHNADLESLWKFDRPPLRLLLFPTTDPELAAAGRPNVTRTFFNERYGSGLWLRVAAP